MSAPCPCKSESHSGSRVVLTGGPGAGKTAILEVVRRHFCEHVAVLPESASIIFSGGFPRKATAAGRRAAQRAIFRVQRELEQLGEDEGAALTLCDRGTVDGAAYWPGPEEEFWAQLGTSREAELARYRAVIHLRTPGADNGYNHQNPMRIESAREAAEIDERIALCWEGHPRRYFVDSRRDFLQKAQEALHLIRAEVPACCRAHLPDGDE